MWVRRDNEPVLPEGSRDAPGPSVESGVGEGEVGGFWFRG